MYLHLRALLNHKKGLSEAGWSQPFLELLPLPGIGLGIAKVKAKVAQSCPTLCEQWTLWSMEFSRPEYWSG